MATVGAILDVFTWVGIGAALVLGVIAVVLWAADGTWLSAEAYIDHDDGVTTVRWFDGDGEANSAVAGGDMASALAGVDRAWIWYRHGRRGRMRLTRRSPEMRPVVGAALALLGVGIVSFIGAMVLLFVERG